MAALSHVVDLRRNALPVYLASDLDREIIRRERPNPPQGDGGHPRLTATWRVGTAGVLVCTWSLGIAGPGIPSG